MDRKDETMNLEELKNMLSDVSDTDAFDLDSIIAEVEGMTPSASSPAASPVREAPAVAPVEREEPQPEPEEARPRGLFGRRRVQEESEEEFEDEPEPEEARPRGLFGRRRAQEEPEEEFEDEPELEEARPRGLFGRRRVQEEPEEEFEDEPEPEQARPRGLFGRRRAQEEPATEETEESALASDDTPDPEQMQAQERAARIAAREARAQERRRRAALKAQQRQEAEQWDEDAEQSVPEEKMSRKQARAARRAAEEAEEEAEIHLRDPQQAQRAFKRRAVSLSVRSMIVLVLTVVAAYISVAPLFEQLPLPIVLDAIENPVIGIGVLLVLQVIAMFLGVEVFGMGFYNLLHGKPDRTSMVSLAVTAALLHGISILVLEEAPGVQIPYLAVSMLLLYAAMREERGRYAGRARAYQAICSVQYPMAVYSHYDAEDDACRAVKGPLHDSRAFLVEMERPDTADRFAMIYSPIAIAASIILALLCSVGQGQPLRFFWAFSALLCISAPLGMLCAGGAAYKNISRRLMGSGAAIAGARQANLLRDTEEVVLAETDLFPTGSITLEALQNMGQVSDAQLLALAAAVTSQAGLELGRVLTGVLREQGGQMLNAQNLQVTEGGVYGEVGARRVVIGTAALMLKMGHRLRAEQRADQVHTYITVDNALVGALVLRYQPTKNTYHAMRLMRRMRMSPLLAVQDFNISPTMVESEFDLRRGTADQPEPGRVARLLAPSYTEKDAPAAILTREGAGSFVQVLRCADKLTGAVRSALTLGAFAGVCGMLIVFYLLYNNAADALVVRNLLLYLLIWYVPTFLIIQQTH